MPLERQPYSPRLVLTVLMVALAVWSVYVAVGAYLYNFNPWRAVVVIACMAVFLGGWIGLLWGLARRKRH